MKKIYAAIILLLYLTTMIVFPVSAQAETMDESVTMGSHSIDAQLPVLGTDEKITNVKSALLYEVNSDTLMYAWNADEKMAPASLVKILTALIAIEKGDLNANVTVSGAVLNSVAYNAAKTGLVEGEVLTLEDLLYCMMVDSGNDAAAVIADHVCGSQAAFVDEMNLYAAKLGCKATNFANVHGLHDENQYTTARDVGRILSEASKNETFCKIFGTIYHSVPANDVFNEERHLSTENYLLNNDEVKTYYNEHILGSRTGVDNDGLRCVASVAEQNGLRFVIVIMGSASMYEEGNSRVKIYGGYKETSELLSFADDGFRRYQLIFGGQVLKQTAVANGDCSVSLGAMNSVSTVLPAGVKVSDLTVKYENSLAQLQAPIKKGQIVSSVKYMHGSSCVGQTDLYALNSVNSVGEDGVLTIEKPQVKKTSGWKAFLNVVIVIVVVLLLVFAIFQVYRFVVINRNKQHKRRHSSNRRRSK